VHLSAILADEDGISKKDARAETVDRDASSLVSREPIVG
jgi:hypothetical protein